MTQINEKIFHVYALEKLFIYHIKQKYKLVTKVWAGIGEGKHS